MKLLEGLIWSDGCDPMKTRDSLAVHFEPSPAVPKTQLAWIDYWNERGMKMAAAPEIYSLLKYIATSKDYDVDTKAGELKEFILEAAKNTTLLTSTISEYDISKNQMTVIYRNRRWKPIEQFQYGTIYDQDMPLKSVIMLPRALLDSNWEKYLQEAMLTKDKISDIGQAFTSSLNVEQRKVMIICRKGETIKDKQFIFTIRKSQYLSHWIIGIEAPLQQTGYSLGVRL